ncbi:MAG TPA: DUF4124 domain-containing protein [Candidatus Binatia bacterium]|nr:DUF4124 domain-containing protein [Candidatus Binatia bacterium]
MRLALMLSMLLCASVQAAEVYKWVDSDGKVHYGDRPKHDAEALDVRPGSGAATSAAPGDPAARAAACDDKRKQLESYRKAGAIKEQDALGRMREYTPEERAQLLALTEKQVAEACSPAAATP